MKSNKSESEEKDIFSDVPSEKIKQMEEEFMSIRNDQEKEEKIERNRLKSKLFYSDRALLHNQQPQVGIAFDKYDQHRSPAFKSMMLARYGKSTGINPKVAWPTKEEIELQKEYEAVLYDGPKSVPDMIKEVHEKERLEHEQIIQVEKEIREKLAKQEQEIKAWQKRVENRNVFAERERQKRQQILDELRDEFGYEINPNDQQFAEKIAEKEKEMAKAIKAERKLKKQEQ